MQCVATRMEYASGQCICKHLTHLSPHVCSRLGFVQTKPKPSDNNVVLLVVAGPVTPYELRRVAEVAEQTGKTLLLAGTRLSSPDEFLGDFLASS